MQTYLSPKNETKWLIAPLRKTFSGAKREDSIVKFGKTYDFRYLNIISVRDAFNVSYSTEGYLYDFAARFLDYCLDTKIDNALYVEKFDDSRCLIVEVKNGAIKQDKYGSSAEILKVLDSVELDDYQKVMNFELLIEGTHANVENLSAALTDTLKPSDKYSLIPEREALKNISTRKPYLLYMIVAFALVFFLKSYFFTVKEEVSETEKLPPFQSYYDAMKNDAVQIKNRMSQDYNFHVGLLSLYGWKIDKVNHTKGQVSYRVLPTGKGSISELESFARKNSMFVMVNTNEIVLITNGANIPSLPSPKPKVYVVEEVHHFVRDAINQYVPGARLSFIRDIPKGKEWVVRELMVDFRGIFKEDLVTLGDITRKLPVSFGGDNIDPNVGQYIVENERFTGSLKISIFGEK